MRLNESIKVIKNNKYLILFALLLVLPPLIFVTNTNELFEFPKMFFVYIVGTFTLAVFLTELVNKPRKLILPSKPVLLFVLAFIISTFFSTHVYTSVWGYYTRFNDALISTLIYAALYFISLNVLTAKDFKILLRLAVLTILPIGFYGVSQHYSGSGSDFVAETDRVFSTFGQPNWLAQYLVMLIPFSLILAFREKFIFWVSVYFAGFSCLWLTYSLSGYLGFAASMLFLVALFVRKTHVTRGNLAKVFVLVLITGLISITNLGIFSSRVHDAWTDLRRIVWASVEVYAQENPADYKVSDAGYIREGLWRGTWFLVTSSPKTFLLGTGPETFPYQFQKYRPLILNYSSEWDFVFNKPHNYYLELLSEQGIIGLIAYLILSVNFLKKKSKILIPGFVGFLVSCFFGWPVVSTAILFWLFLALAERNAEL